MKNMRMNSKQIMKRILAVLMCVIMVVSVISVSSTSYATEGSSDNQSSSSETTSTATTGSETQTSSSDSVSANGNIDPNGILGKNSDVGIEVTKSITGKAGEAVTVAFVLKSNNIASVKLKSVYPVIDSSFPFETSGDSYKIITADDEQKQQALEAAFNMTARSDLEKGYHSVRFIGEYQKIATDGSVQDYYVIKTINIYFASMQEQSSEVEDDSEDGKKNDKDNDKNNKEDDQDEENYDDEDSSGGYDDSYSGGGGEEEVAAPKLIITGYETNPEKIMAGETFTITIHIQNTSKTTSVCNGKFLVGNEAGSFVPTSGSNAVFVEKIAAGETGDIVMEMKAGADLQQKNYSLVVKGDFDDGRGNNFTSSDSMTIPVYQKVDFNITEVTMSPEILGVGDSGSLMFTINNTSTAGIYNASVAVKDDYVSAEPFYIGNIAGSSSAYATLMVTGLKENPETGTITVEITYEDASGNKATIEKFVACQVGPFSSYGEDEFDGEELEGEEVYEEDFYISPIWIVVIVLVLVGIIAGVIVFFVLRRKKQMAELLETEDGEDDLYDENV